MNKAQELYNRALASRDTLDIAAEEFYNETVLKFGEEIADAGYFGTYFERDEVPENLRDFIDTLVLPIFEKNGFSVRIEQINTLFGGPIPHYHIGWDMKGEENERST